MPAYLIVTVDVRDAERYEAYKDMVPPSLAPFGGRFVVRGGSPQTIEGDWSPKRVVVLEFDTAERARAWWASDEYREAKALRQATTSTQMILVEGA